jgi:hypothetical protein
MHQYKYKTVAQILLILSIFDLVLAAPVVREIHDARGDVARPVVVTNVATMSKERRQSSDAGPMPLHSSPPSPDGSTHSHPSPQYSEVETPPHPPPPPPEGSIPPNSSSQVPDGPYSPPPLSDGSTSWHSSPLLPGWLLHTPSASDEVESLPELPTSPGGPTSSPPGEIVPATGQPVPVGSAAGLPAPVRDRLQVYRATQTPPTRNTLDAQLAVQREFNRFLKKLAAGVAIFGITGGLVAYYRHRNHVHRAIDHD